MATVTSDQLVGKKEDVSDVISMISPTKTPFISGCGNGKVTQEFFQWQEDSLAAVNTGNAQVQGFTSTPDSYIPTVLRSNHTQIFTKGAQLDRTTQSTSVYGRQSERARLITNKGLEIKRDLEATLIGTHQAAQAPVGNSVAGNTASVFAQTDSSAIITPGTAAPITEADVIQAMQIAYQNGADPTTLMVKVTDASAVANFARAGNGQARQLNDGSKTLVNAIDTYVTPFGTLDVVPNRFIKSTDALVYDRDMFSLEWLDKWFTEDLAKTGDSEQFMITCEVGLKNMNQKGSVLITNLA